MALDTSTTLIDFDIIRSNSCKAIKVLDLSNWSSSEEDLSYIEITTPGSTVKVTHVFQKEKLNIFNANNLQLSDVTDYSSLSAIPDGVYTITILQCENDPNSVTKYHFQDCLIRCQVARKLIALDLDCDSCRKTLIKEIQNITLFLDAAKANVDKCNVNKAMELYRRANTILDRISENSDSGCTNC